MGRMIRADYDQMLLLPPRVDDWIAAAHPARLIRDFVDALDLGQLGFAVPEARAGRPAYAPDLLLKVWLCGYFHRLRSTRSLEKACCDSIALIWLTGNHPPDHNTLWRFWRTNKGALPGLFKKSVHVAVASDLVSLARQAVDGTKIAAQVRTARAEPESAEVPFARLKHLHGFRQWTARGLENVRAQWALLCTTLNLHTLYGLWRTKRLKAAAVELLAGIHREPEMLLASAG